MVWVKSIDIHFQASLTPTHHSQRPLGNPDVSATTEILVWDTWFWPTLFRLLSVYPLIQIRGHRQRESDSDWPSNRGGHSQMPSIQRLTLFSHCAQEVQTDSQGLDRLQSTFGLLARTRWALVKLCGLKGFETGTWSTGKDRVSLIGLFGPRDMGNGNATVFGILARTGWALLG